MVNVTASVNNADDQIMIGLEGEAAIFYGETENLNVLPFDSIGQDENGEFVYILTSENKTKKQYVKTGKEIDTDTEIIEGVTGEDIIIIEPIKISGENKFVVVG